MESLFTIDPEFKNLIPPLTKDELNGLKQDIIQNGCRNPLTVWQEENILIDGHHRFAICKDHGIPFETNLLSFADRTDAKLFALNEQLNRRNLNDFQRTELQFVKEPLIKEKAKQKQKEAGERYGRGLQNNEQLSQNSAKAIDTREAIATQAGVSHDTVHKVKKIINDGTEELKDKARSGQISINAGAVIADEPKEEQTRIVALTEKEILDASKEIKARKAEEKRQSTIQAQSQEALNNPEQAILYQKPATDFLNTLDSESIDLLITDPPYSTDVEDITNFVNEWLLLALSKIKPTGRAYICTGAYPNEICTYLNLLYTQDKFSLENILVWTYRNTIGPVLKKKYKLNWQAVFYLTGPDAPDLNCPKMVEQFSVHDITAPDGRHGNRFHSWQKPDELAERFIRHATNPGDVLIDPFAGTGTFLLAGGRLGRKSFGTEINKETLKIAKQRGCIFSQ